MVQPVADRGESLDGGVGLGVAAAVNLRAVDDATWEFSAVRPSGAPTSGTYQSAAALTVAGSGRYLGLWARL